MKKIYLFLITLLFISIPIDVFAAGNITYYGTSKEFVFLSDEDIFGNFKNIMPGDKLTEQIIIKNSASKNVKIKLYVRSLGATEETRDFLSQLNLTVKKTNSTNLFKGPASETENLTDWTYLGTIYSGGKVNLDVILEVPLELSNEYQDKVGYVNWQFKVEELPVSSDDPKNPSTLDNIFSYFVLSGISLLIIIIFLTILVIKNKKDKKSK